MEDITTLKEKISLQGQLISLNWDLSESQMAVIQALRAEEASLKQHSKDANAKKSEASFLRRIGPAAHNAHKSRKRRLSKLEVRSGRIFVKRSSGHSGSRANEGGAGALVSLREDRLREAKLREKGQMLVKAQREMIEALEETSKMLKSRGASSECFLPL